VRVDGDTLRNGIESAQSFFGNEYEFELILNKTGMSAEDIRGIVEFMVITHGENGATIINGEDEYKINAVLTDTVVDPTGGGDAFRGGFLTGYSHSWDWEMCGNMGALAATICLESDGPQGHEYTREEFVGRFREHFGDAGKLEELLKD
jgi:adenosine kinase